MNMLGFCRGLILGFAVFIGFVVFVNVGLVLLLVCLYV